MTRLILLLLGIASIFSLITYLFHYLFKKNKIIKYFPAIISMLFALYYLYLAQTSYTGFEDIARAILAVMLITGFFAGIVTGVIIDLIYKYKNN